MVVWGENSAFEYGSKKINDTGFKLDNNWIKTYGVTHGTTANDWIDKELDKKSLTAYFGPSQKEMRNFNLSAVFFALAIPLMYIALYCFFNFIIIFLSSFNTSGRIAFKTL